MTIQYLSYTIIGCKIPRERLFRQKPSPNKNIRNNCCVSKNWINIKFCPDCGTQLQILKEREPHPELDLKNKKFRSTNIDVVWDSEQKNFFFGTILKASDDFSNGLTSFLQIQNPGNIEIIKQNLQKALEPNGLWKEDVFGIYTMLYIGE